MNRRAYRPNLGRDIGRINATACCISVVSWLTSLAVGDEALVACDPLNELLDAHARPPSSSNCKSESNTQLFFFQSRLVHNHHGMPCLITLQ